MEYAGTRLPPGWLWCNGAEVSKNAYKDLYEAIGDTFGPASDSSKFKLPDRRERSAMGKGDMGGTTPPGHVTSGVSGIDSTVLGGVGGDQNMPSHRHSIQFERLTTLIGGGALDAVDLGTGVSDLTDFEGTGTAANMPPTIVMNFIIRT